MTSKKKHDSRTVIQDFVHNYARPLIILALAGAGAFFFQVYRQWDALNEHQDNQYKWLTDQEQKIENNMNSITALARDRALACEDREAHCFEVLRLLTILESDLRALKAELQKLKE